MAEHEATFEEICPKKGQKYVHIRDTLHHDYAMILCASLRGSLPHVESLEKQTAINQSIVDNHKPWREFYNRSLRKNL